MKKKNRDDDIIKDIRNLIWYSRDHHGKAGETPHRNDVGSMQHFWSFSILVALSIHRQRKQNRQRIIIPVHSFTLDYSYCLCGSGLNA
jgi:hypothetical protein